MINLNQDNYGKVKHLVTSQNELSVCSVLDGIMAGEIMVSSEDNLDAMLIQSSETMLIAGRTDNEDFNQAVAGAVDFWDQVTPDSEEWRIKLPDIHCNKYIREYTRHRYTLTREDFIPAELSLPEGYVLESVDLKQLRQHNYINADKIYAWAEAWGSEEHFEQAGCGCYIRHQDKIVSWSLSDCYAEGRIAVGIHTDIAYRKMGLAKQVVSAVIGLCFDKGYDIVEWLCVSTNIGSKAIARRLGFKLASQYASFTPYPPIENLTDLTEEEWFEWGTYLEQALPEESRLYLECLNCYIKANAAQKTMEVIEAMGRAGHACNPEQLNGMISYYQSEGLCSAFKTPVWENFIACLEDKSEL